MNKPYIQANDKSRERLQKLAEDITDEELKLVIYKEGWTIAAALGHIAFWDEWRRALLRKWQQDGITASGLNNDYTHIYNDGLLPFLLVIPPRKAAELAVESAGKLDKEIASLPPETVKAIEALDDPMALNRAIHRNMHLDEIDVLLKAKRGGK